MDWDLKMAYWGDFPELDQNAGSSFVPAAAGSSSGMVPGRLAGAPDCSVDLKLGGSGEFGRPERWKEQMRLPPPPPVASKRSRPPGNGGQVASCLVDGCSSDLGKCREYHQRHKVCEVHSKTQVVMVGGHEQRFCQQCSRFHLLGEFDEVKRSCRKRLDGHNRRRRKPQPDPISSSGFFSNHHQGTRFISYPPLFPSATALPENNWSGIVKPEDESFYSHPPTSRQHNLPSSFSISFKDGKKFPLPQDSNGVASLGASGRQPTLLKTIPCSESTTTSNIKIFAEGIPQVFNSECALSLLSSPSHNTSINPVHIVPGGEHRTPLGQPLVPSLHFSGGGLGQYPGSHVSSGEVSAAGGFACSGMEDEHGVGGGVLISDGGGDDPGDDLHCQGFFHVMGEGGSEGTSLALPFSWQ